MQRGLAIGLVVLGAAMEIAGLLIIARDARDAANDQALFVRDAIGVISQLDLPPADRTETTWTKGRDEQLMETYGRLRSARNAFIALLAGVVIILIGNVVGLA